MIRYAALSLWPLLAAVSALAEQGEGFQREGKPEERKVRDSLEGKPPRAIHVQGWMNVGTTPPDLKKLKGKVVVLNVFADW